VLIFHPVALEIFLLFLKGLLLQPIIEI